MTAILGISAYYHDSATALVGDGDIVAAAQEERFSRKKHVARSPQHAICYCLQEGGLCLKDVDYVVFYDKPLVKFERLLETYLAYAPKGFCSFLASMPIWLKEKLYPKHELKRELVALGGIREAELAQLLFNEHHRSHAASAFFPSPFNRAAVMCLDGVGEWATCSVWQGDGHHLTPLWEINFPHSLGLLYFAFTYYTGFKVNSGEYKVMWLAPYGEPKYVKAILKHVLDLKDDGSFLPNMAYFNYATGLNMTNERFHQLFGGPPRKPESPLEQRHMDLAKSIQVVTEEVVLRLARTVQRMTGNDYLCLAGGVALNCVAHGRIQREGPYQGYLDPTRGRGCRRGTRGGPLGLARIPWQVSPSERGARRHARGLSGSALRQRCHKSLAGLGRCTLRIS